MFKTILLLTLFTYSCCVEDFDDAKGIALSEGKNAPPNNINGGKSVEKLNNVEHCSRHRHTDSDSPSAYDYFTDIPSIELLQSSPSSHEFKTSHDQKARSKSHSNGMLRYAECKRPTTSKSELQYCTCCGRYFREDDQIAPGAGIGKEGVHTSVPEIATWGSGRRLSLKQEEGLEKIPQLRPEKCRFKTHKMNYSEENYAVNLRGQKKGLIPQRRTSVPRVPADESQGILNEPEVQSSDIYQGSTEEIDFQPQRKYDNTLKRTFNREDEEEVHQNARKIPANDVVPSETIKLAHERVRFSSTPETVVFDVVREKEDSQIARRGGHSSVRNLINNENDISTDRAVLHNRLENSAILKVQPTDGSKKLRAKSPMHKQLLNVTLQKKYNDDSWGANPHDNKGQGSLILHNIEDKNDLSDLKDVIALKYGGVQKSNRGGVRKEHLKPLDYDRVDDSLKVRQNNRRIVGSKLQESKENPSDEKYEEDSTKSINSKSQGRAMKESHLTHLKKQGSVFMVHDTSRINKRNAQEIVFDSNGLFDSQPIYTYQESQHSNILPKRETVPLRSDKRIPRNPNRRVQNPPSSVIVKGSKMPGFSNFSDEQPLLSSMQGPWYE